VMVPRIGIRAINVDDSLDEVLEMIVRAGHSRLPVFEENLDNIVGILYAKDLLRTSRAMAEATAPSTSDPSSGRRSTSPSRSRSTTCSTRCRSRSATSRSS
jgi:CBS domain containing-hemolysin-like protein